MIKMIGTKIPLCITWIMEHMDNLIASSMIMRMWSPFCKRDPNQMKSIIHPAYGNQHVMALINLLSTVVCPGCIWGTECSLKMWVLTPLLLFLLSMDSRGQLSAMWCQGQHGNWCSESKTMTSHPKWRSRTSALCLGEWNDMSPTACASAPINM